MSLYYQLIHDIFSSNDCKLLIKKAEKKNFYEDNQKEITYIKNEKIANDIFEDIKNKIPQTFNGFKIKGISPKLKFIKFNEKVSFEPEKIESIYNKNLKNVLGLFIFLNNDFYKGDIQLINSKKNIQYSASPIVGTGLLFDLNYKFEHNSITNGTKYVLYCELLITNEIINTINPDILYNVLQTNL
jgi:hypothetical protein